MAYAQSIRQYNDLDTMLNIAIALPQNKLDATELGKVHNMTLNSLHNESYKIDNIVIDLDPLEASVVHSLTYQRFYSSYMSDQDYFDIDNMITDYANEDRVVQLFLQLYQQYPNGIEDVNYIINKYIEIIEQDAEITDENKHLIYSAICVASYSTEYWTNLLNEE